MKSREEIVQTILKQLASDAGELGRWPDTIPPLILEIALELFRPIARDIVASGVKYLIVAKSAAILCLQCGAVSHNPNDVEQRYCAACHAFLDQPEATKPWN